jgi:multidrug resistance efflux pump
MRKFTFAQKGPVIKTLKEPKVNKKKWNSDRSIFIAILLILAIWLIRHVYLSLAIIEVDGQLTMNKMAVNFTDDIRIKQLNVGEGESVCKGDILFYYINRELETRQVDVFYRNEMELKLKGEKQMIEKSLALKSIEKENTVRALQFNSRNLKKMKELVLLSVYEIDELNVMMEKDLEYKGRIKELSAEIAYLQAQLNDLSDQQRLQNSNTASGLGNGFQPFKSPMNGIIGRINLNENEICYEGMDAMTIHHKDQLMIKAYFDQKEMSNIGEGEAVEILFPDNSTGMGRISTFYVSTYELPPEFQKKYEPTQRTILVDIIPLDNTDMKKWKKYYKMNVKVRKRRF